MKHLLSLMKIYFVDFSELYSSMVQATTETEKGFYSAEVYAQRI